ncbi:MAG: mechanosensitive ion channel [Algoriphagus sp.]|nr:mechanosensitive ion channel [Algoriphagus sp.]
MKFKSLFFIFLSTFLAIAVKGQDTIPSQSSIVEGLFVEDATFDSLVEANLAGPQKPTLEDLITKGKLYSVLANQIKLDLFKPLDTLEYSQEIIAFNNTIERITQSIQTPGKNFNLRYINGLNWVTNNIGRQNQDFEKTIDKRMSELTHLDSLLKTIKNDKLLTYNLKDSSIIPAYSEAILKLKGDIIMLDSALYSQQLITARFQSEVSKVSINLMTLDQFIEINKKELERSLLTKEINYLWETNSIPSPRTILEISKESIDLNFGFLKTYLADNKASLGLSLFLIGFVYFLMKTVIKKIESQKDFGKLILERVRFYKKYPLSATMTSLLPLLVFLFERPSLVFITFLIILQVAFTTVLIYEQYEKNDFLKWVIMILFFLFFSISNLFREIVYQERIYLLLGSLFPLYVSGISSRKFKTEDKKEETFLTKISLFMFVLLSFGFLANIFGRFSLAKIVSVAGVTGFMQAISLYFFVNVIMEGIYLLIEYSKKETDTFTSYFDFQGIQKRLKGIFLFAAVLLWTFSFLQNASLKDAVVDYLRLFLEKERFIGDNSFTYGSIILFGLLIYASLLLANTIAYFASVKDQKKAEGRNKKLGSSVLLIRLAIITVGFFIAAAAASIPLNNITIVLGALSVGIGFGLQTIINNLVSGIILAFERPIQIGDEIEVGNMSGTVKEVGIRASKIQAYDGSEIVVPNGDLLSQQLVNWTLSDNRRRIEIKVGVSYGSDMQKVKSVIDGVLAREKVLKIPLPRVLMENFGDSSVEFRVLFWVETIDIWLDMRAEIMSAIYEAFQKNGIEIPFPKRDLYLKGLPEDIRESLEKIFPVTESVETENKKSPET